MNIRPNISLIALALILPALPSAGHAQSLVAGKQPVNFETLDLSVPQSPAFTILGVSPQNATNPATPSELTASLFNGSDPYGNFQTGVAIDTNPYFLFEGPNVTLNDYQTNQMERLLTNTQLSIATTKGAESADQATRVAAGIHITPWIHSKHDPRRNTAYLDCLGDALTEFSEKVPDSIDPNNPKPDNLSEADQEALEEQTTLSRAAYDKCQKKFEPILTNPSAWTVGVSPTWTSEGGSIDDLEWSGAAVWTTLSLRLPTDMVGNLGNLGQFIVHARYRTDEMVPDSSGSGDLRTQDSAVAAARLKFGRASWNTSVEGSYIYTNPDDVSSDSYVQLTGGLEFRLSEGIWFEFTTGSTLGRADDDEAFALAGLKWNFLDGLTQ